MQVCFQELTQSLAGQHVLGYLYDAADHGRAKARFQRAIEDLCMLPLIEKVSELRPSAIICTHFLPAQVRDSCLCLRRVVRWCCGHRLYTGSAVALSLA